MKKFLMTGLVVIFPMVISYMAGCTSKGNPISTTLPPTFTKTNTPNGTFTATPTAQAVFPVIYSNGNLATVVTATNSFSGGGSPGYPTLNAADTSFGGYGGDASGYLTTWTSGEVAAMTGYSGFSLAGGSINFTGYTTCTFWAKANQTATVGFNAAEPPSDTANVPESLTTTWTQYTINIASGARSDGQSGAISSVTTYFVCVIVSAPGATPLQVSIDKISFQGAGATSTFTNTPTNTPSNTPGGASTSTFTMTPTNTVTNTPGATQIIFDDSLHVATTESEFDGGGGASTTSNLADTSNPYQGTVDALWTFTALGTGGYEGWNVTSPTTNVGSFTNCIFWAKTSRAFAGTGIEFYGGGGTDNGGPVNHSFALTTTYTQYSFALPQPLDQVTIPFGIVINGTDVSDLGTAGALNVYVDDIYYQ